VEAGYLGVGNMGQPMAHTLLDAGHGLTIYDINEAAGRTFAGPCYGMISESKDRVTIVNTWGRGGE
jgi:3-hydroxyisobutyrate dehydrogenase-like beta-hydroxyacid dehydrogenase